MSGAVVTPRTTIVNNAAKAVAGKQVCDPNSPCQPCQRGGLQMLIVLPSVVPKEHAPALKDRHSFPPSFDSEFVAIEREATAPVARMLREGYVYLYYLHRKRWDVWQVMQNGLARKIMHQVDTDEYEKERLKYSGAVAPKSCSRGAANVPAQLISLTGAETTPQVWLAFSSSLWSAYVLQRYANNPEVEIPGPDGKSTGKRKLRDLRGREISPQSVLTSGSSPYSLPLNQAALEHGIADFAAAASADYRTAFELGFMALDEARIGKAAAFESEVRALELANSPASQPQRYLRKTIVLMLPDPLGVAELHNHLRLAQDQARRLWSIGSEGIAQRPDPERVWKLRSSLHAEMIEQWEAARDRQRITGLVSRELHKRMPPVTEEDYRRGMASGKYPPGTGWAPLNQLDWLGDPQLDANKEPIAQTVASQRHPGARTRLGRISLPPEMVKQAANVHGAGTAEGFRARLRSRLDWDALTAFRKGWAEECERWDEQMARFERDYLAWTKGMQCTAVLLYDFND